MVFITITVHGKKHVVRISDDHDRENRRKGGWLHPSYRGTGGALTGVLRENETLDDFLEWYELNEEA